MSRRVLIGLIPAVLAAPAVAQPMDHSAMPGMAMPAAPGKPAANLSKAPEAAAPHPQQHPAAEPAADVPPAEPAADAVDPHAGHGAPVGKPAPEPPAMPAMDTSATAAAGTAPMSRMQVPQAPPPAPPRDHAAERYFDPATMARARAQLRREHGAMPASKVMANLFEYQARSGEDGYRWDGQAWFGGDINRLVLKSEGEGTRRGGVESAELQALYSRAVGVYTDVQLGVRQDVEPRNRTYATIGFETLFPYWFDVEGAAFLSDKGELLGRIEGTYDLRLTNRLILQPRAELNLAAQDTAATGTGSGLSSAELGLRLRYEIRREFAPYIGVSWDRQFGRTADYSRARGEDVEAKSLVFGVRAFF